MGLGINATKLFSLPMMLRTNKPERLSLTSFISLVKYLKVSLDLGCVEALHSGCDFEIVVLVDKAC
jgi:hypothetical protein